MESILQKIIEDKVVNRLILCYSTMTQEDIIKKVCDEYRKSKKILKPKEIDETIMRINIPIGLYVKTKCKNYVYCFTNLIKDDLKRQCFFYDDELDKLDEFDETYENYNKYDISYFDIPLYEINKSDFDVKKQNTNREKIAEEKFKIQVILNN